MKKLKLTIIGSGSTYTPELIDGIIERRESIPVGEIYLMDIDERKRSIVGSLCQRMVEAAGLGCKVVLTDDLDRALEGADFVITQIRVGKLPARVLDEKIPLKYGLIGQETTGIGGFFKALRTVPVLLDMASRMERLCPNAFLINFTNPSGIVTEALQNHSRIRSIGLCNVPINMVADVKKNLGVQEAQIQYLGLNHLSWITKIVSGGEDLTEKALSQGLNVEAMKNIKPSGFSPECIAAVRGIPSSYLEYFYNRNKKLEEEKSAEKCRGEVCMDIEEELLKIYADSALHVKPKQLEQRGGSKYSLAAISLVDAIVNDRQEVHIVDVKNQGALEFMGDDDVVEIPCIVGKDGAHPIAVRDFHNEHIISMMRMMKAYERHTVRAAGLGDENEAMRALLINPLIGDFNAAKACFAELKEAHARYLPQFRH